MKLHIKAKVISVHSKMDILDEQDELAYKVQSKALSIHDKTYIRNRAGDEVAYIHAKAISIHSVHYVEMADGVNFEMSEELWHLTKDIINIPELGWQLRGDFTAHNYEMLDANGNVIATAHRKWFSLHGIYYLDVLEEDKAEVAVAVYVVLEHMISARETAAAASCTPAGTYGETETHS